METLGPHAGYGHATSSHNGPLSPSEEAALCPEELSSLCALRCRWLCPLVLRAPSRSPGTDAASGFCPLAMSTGWWLLVCTPAGVTGTCPRWNVATHGQPVSSEIQVPDHQWRPRVMAPGGPPDPGQLPTYLFIQTLAIQEAEAVGWSLVLSISVREREGGRTCGVHSIPANGFLPPDPP